MAIFEYEGINSKGKETRGVVDADSLKLARGKLRESGIYPTHLAEEKRKEKSHKIPLLAFLEKGLGGRIKSSELSSLYRQLSTLVGAGVPLVEALTGLMEQAENVRLKRSLTGLREKINEGSSFAEAAREYPNLFSELFVNMIAVGETSGTLEIVLSRLSDIYEENMKLISRVRGAMVYPILMALIGAGVMFFLMTYVIPKVTEVFKDSQAALPLPTEILLLVSGFLNSFWYLLFIALIGAVLLIRKYLQTEKGRMRYDTQIIRLPIIGELLRLTAFARFSRTLATLLTSGVPMLKSLEIVARVVNNKRIAEVIEEAKEKIGEGASLSQPLKNSGIFPPTVVQMIAVGERSGDLEPMLVKAAEAFESQLEIAISALTSILEPLIILVMAFGVGFIVIAILLPIFEMSQLVK